MKVKRKHLVTVWLFVGVLLVGMIAMQGCETSEPGGSGALAEARREMNEQRHKAMIMSETETEFHSRHNRNILFCLGIPYKRSCR